MKASDKYKYKSTVNLTTKSVMAFSFLVLYLHYHSGCIGKARQSPSFISSYIRVYT